MGLSVDPNEQQHQKRQKTLCRTKKCRANAQEQKADDAYSPIVLFFVGNKGI